MTLSPVNYAVGLGAIVPDGEHGGQANYYDFQARPYFSQGSWTSAPLDRGGVPQQAGAITWQHSSPAGTSIQIETRASSDGQNWGPWSGPYPQAGGSAVAGQPLRWIQVKATLNSDNAGQNSPVLHSIQISQPDFEGSAFGGSQLKILPNPVRGPDLVIEYLLPLRAGRVDLELSSLASQVLWKGEGPIERGKNQLKLDARELANGVYLLRTTVTGYDGSRQQVVKKVVVLR
jgi:hypothetical protein